MRTFLLAAIASAALALPAYAAPVTIAPATFSPEFQEKLEDDIGVREAARLQRIVDSALTRSLTREGGQVGPGAAVTVETTIVDARANHPTFQQMIDNTSLDGIRSYSTGGAELTGVIRHADGRELGRVEHRFFESSLTFLQIEDWGDARRAINQFARKIAVAYRSAGL